MRRIFIDLGAWDGSSAEYFKAHHPEANQFEYFLFEPLPDNIKKLKKLQNVTIIPKAAATRTGKSKFYTGLSESGSVYKEKRTGGLDGKTCIEVDAIDFPGWLDDLVGGEYSEIWLKMNIEGAEYPIIDMLWNYGLIPFVHRWYVQWHWDKIGIDREEHYRIKRLIPAEKLFPWFAMIRTDNKWFNDSLHDNNK